MFSEDFWRGFPKQVSCFGETKIEKKLINPNILKFFFDGCCLSSENSFHKVKINCFCSFADTEGKGLKVDIKYAKGIELQPAVKKMGSTRSLSILKCKYLILQHGANHKRRRFIAINKYFT